MSEPTLLRRIMAGEGGIISNLLCGVLRAGEFVYGMGVALRNRRYDRPGVAKVFPIPVISVGNLTTGGTGKTPLVIDIVRRLERRGLSPAVVARGYKAAEGGLGDEQQLIATLCPGVVCVVDADRAAGCELAHRQFGADVIVLDDGFQHRRVHRVLDVVAVDATCPFGYGHLLPRGMLREPVSALRRARLVVVTRCDQVSPAELARLDGQLDRWAERAVRLHCHHVVTSIEGLDGKPLTGSPAGRRAVLFAGIGSPRAFLNTVRALGVDVVGQRWWSDHHHYRANDIHSLLRPGRFPAHDFLLTTEKDAIKLARLPGMDDDRIAVVKIAIDFLEGGDKIMDDVLRNCLGGS